MSAALTDSTGAAVSRESAAPKRPALGWAAMSHGGLYHLLWREFRYLFGWAVATCVLTAVLQLANGVLFARDVNGYVSYRAAMYGFSFVAPLIFLLGVLAASFAIERDETSVQWTNILPIPWRSALAVKVLIAIGGAGLCFAIGLTTAIGLGSLIPVPERMAAGDWTRLSDLVWSQSTDGVYYFSLLALLLFPVAICAILTVRNAANGLILAVVAMITSELVWVSTLQKNTLIRQWQVSVDAAPRVEFWGTLIGAVLLWLAALWLYRWRWSSGMYAQWSVGLGARGATALDPAPHHATAPISAMAPTHLTWSDRAAAGSAPRAMTCLFWLTWRRMGLIGLLAIASLTLLWCGGGLTTHQFYLGSWVIPRYFLLVSGYVGLLLAAGGGGIWAFAGSSTAREIGFLADRGVSPTQFWFSHYLGFVGAITGLAVLGAFGLSLLQPPSWPLLTDPVAMLMLMTLVIGTHSIGVAGMIAGQSLRSWQMATFALAISSLLVFYLYPQYWLTSGTWGTLWFLLIPSLGLPISWLLTRQGLVGWQPRLTWVFPLFATSVFVLSYLSIPYVRVAVLPSPLAAVAVERAMPPIWLAKIPRLPAGSRQAMKKVFLDERNPGPAELHPLHTLKLQASVRDVYRPQLDLLMAQNQSESTQTESISAEASTVPADYWFGYECRESLISLGEMAGSALWVGEYETAALALRIRGRLVQEVYPGFDIVNWDATQAVFLERMNTIDDETFLQLEQHIPFEQWLPDLDDPAARAAWEAAIEAQLSYLARHPVQVVDGRSARVATTPATQSEVRRSDQFMAENFRNIRWIDSRNDFLSISSWGSTWLWHLEPERSRRETSQMYRLWQTYLQQGVVPNRSLDDDDWVGPWHNYDVVTAKIQQRQREVRATATLRQRLLSLRHDSTP